MTTPAPLHRALHAPGPRPLPDTAARLLRTLDAPPRLVAHLRLVHDVAYRLTDWLAQQHPALPLDREAVLFGAATHDIGKTTHVAELSGPGSAHENAGQDLLLAHGIPPHLARFAATHATWTLPDIGLEDLLVSVADKIWKNKRVPELEDLVVRRLAEASGRTVWEEFLEFDDALTAVGEDAEERLAFQAAHPV
ncbi:HD domain-containing protein [Streptomyces griseorubiginosus]|uniref:HD domain-containing protein n=1 Tax=Streptomyces griseorubiginosus TaxID=67304 RepID=UPI002E812509|nr:HD domain-containing protein [Streptomyces griseorubiginosus]WUB43675.1 HD domain-containing protein [Streptomyces griseorubiginosus]WUB52193.1 HD domain-containing protein [Streptomyces griseorubiginosus]